MDHQDREALPLSRPLSVGEVPPEGLDVQIRASADECAAVAAENGLPAVGKLDATLHVKKTAGDGLEVSGEVRARVRQTCVVTLDEFEEDIREPVHMRFAPEIEKPKSRRRAAEDADDHHIHMSDDEDPPDPLIGGAIDLGAIATEFLTLALDPYPRKPGATFAEPAAPDDDATVSPFAKLRSLASGPSERDEG